MISQLYPPSNMYNACDLHYLYYFEVHKRILYTLYYIIIFILFIKYYYNIDIINQIKSEECLYTIVIGSQVPNHTFVYILDTNFSVILNCAPIVCRSGKSDKQYTKIWLGTWDPATAFLWFDLIYSLRSKIYYLLLLLILYVNNVKKNDR